MSLSRTISAAEQQKIISSAHVAVSVFVYSYTNKLGNRRFFTKEDIEDIAGDVGMSLI